VFWLELVLMMLVTAPFWWTSKNVANGSVLGPRIYVAGKLVDGHTLTVVSSL
jgi:hypothetical protein